MNHDQLRQWQRQWRESGTVHDEMRYLNGLCRLGELDHSTLALTAFLGHAAARQIVQYPKEFCDPMFDPTAALSKQVFTLPEDKDERDALHQWLNSALDWPLGNELLRRLRPLLGIHEELYSQFLKHCPECHAPTLPNFASVARTLERLDEGDSISESDYEAVYNLIDEAQDSSWEELEFREQARYGASATSYFMGLWEHLQPSRPAAQHAEDLPKVDWILFNSLHWFAPARENSSEHGLPSREHMQQRFIDALLRW